MRLHKWWFSRTRFSFKTSGWPGQGVVDGPEAREQRLSGAEVCYAVVSFKKTFDSKVFTIKLLVSVQVAQCVADLLWFYVMAKSDWDQEGVKVRGALDHITTSVQFSSVMSDSLQPHGLHHARQGWCIQPSHPLPSPSPPTFNLSSNRVFSNESVLHIRWPKYWSFSFNISPSNEHSGLISFRMDWWDLLAVQGILKSLLQHHSSKASILWYSAFFTVQLSHPLHHQWKNHRLD